MNEKISNALNWRYATKVFDVDKKVSAEDIKTILESAHLAPSSFGVEAWKFFAIENPEVRKKLREVGYDQAQITDASHLVIITQRTDAQNLATELVERLNKITGASVESLDGLKEMVEGSVKSKTESGTITAWLTAQTYIALGMMLETAALLEVDACPMEGFLNEGVDEVLNLKEKNLRSVSMITLGYRGDDKHAGHLKTRREYDDVIEVI